MIINFSFFTQPESSFYERIDTKTILCGIGIATIGLIAYKCLNKLNKPSGASTRAFSQVTPLTPPVVNAKRTSVPHPTPRSIPPSSTTTPQITTITPSSSNQPRQPATKHLMKIYKKLPCPPVKISTDIKSLLSFPIQKYWVELQNKTKQLEINYMNPGQVLAHDMEEACPYTGIILIPFQEKEAFRMESLHANYVGKGIGNSNRILIATQVPKNAENFWLTFSESAQNVTIFDLNGFMDPSTFYKFRDGNVKISEISEKSIAPVILRYRYKVENGLNRTTKEMIRYHIINWEGNSISFENLNTLIELLNRTFSKSKTPLIQCSSGINETAVLITAYFLQDMILAGIITEDNLGDQLSEIIFKLRQQRGKKFLPMPEQFDYLFQYGEYLLSKARIVKQNSDAFNMIDSRNRTESEYMPSTKLVDEKNVPSKDSNTFINDQILHVDNYSFIVSPTSVAAELFWFTVSERTSVIVDFNSSMETAGIHGLPPLEAYYPTKFGEVKTFGNLTINLMSVTKPDEDYKVYEYELTDTAKGVNATKKICRIHYEKWQASETIDFSCLKSILELKEFQGLNQTPLCPIILCKDGLNKIGIFITAAILKEKIRNETINKENFLHKMTELISELRFKCGLNFIPLFSDFSVLTKYAHHLLYQYVPPQTFEDDSSEESESPTTSNSPKSSPQRIQPIEPHTQNIFRRSFSHADSTIQSNRSLYASMNAMSSTLASQNTSREGPSDTDSQPPPIQPQNSHYTSMGDISRLSAQKFVP